MGSESKNKSGDSGGGATQGIPAAMKKLVQNLKEIVNCTDFTEQEIYEVLRECDMDPDRAVERLLAQGCAIYCLLFYLFAMYFC
ncbi:hypothetical protein L6164_031203 [Bauhinia variegata]|uniref:Uncharacterized protein n=1 Tax=Bauhinia variegata TaxID=167791 RepID=A0ACB9LF47_BAUVA|nr:hypothetical protein L6164_031203 [Bauhinia variegata]